MQPDPEPDAGAKVILARFHDSFSLVSPIDLLTFKKQESKEVNENRPY